MPRGNQLARQFYTPSHVVRVLVERLAPYKGRVRDPFCGSDGTSVRSEEFIEDRASLLFAYT
jgi:type I restriction enzyme M protein